MTFCVCLPVCACARVRVCVRVRVIYVRICPCMLAIMLAGLYIWKCVHAFANVCNIVRTYLRTPSNRGCTYLDLFKSHIIVDIRVRITVILYSA